MNRAIGVEHCSALTLLAEMKRALAPPGVEHDGLTAATTISEGAVRTRKTNCARQTSSSPGTSPDKTPRLKEGGAIRDETTGAAGLRRLDDLLLRRQWKTLAVADLEKADRSPKIVNRAGGYPLFVSPSSGAATFFNAARYLSGRIGTARTGPEPRTGAGRGGGDATGGNVATGAAV